MARTRLVNIQAFRKIMMACMLNIFLQVVEMSPSIGEQILASSTSPNTFDMFHILPNRSVGVKLELDMMFTLEQYKAMKTEAKNPTGKSLAIRLLHYRWPNAVMYYEITQSANQFRQIIAAAIDSYHKYTCIRIVENTTAANRVRFIGGDGCYSEVGMVRGIQILSVHKTCDKGVVIHELGHSLGVYHEHSRPDRDTFVRINLSKLGNKKYVSQFDKEPSRYVNTYNIAYDYESVMHYPTLGGIITALDPNFQNIMGKAQELSFKDIKLANLMYNCHVVVGKCPQDKTCRNDGFPYYKELNNLEKCNCVCDSGDVSNRLTNCLGMSMRTLPLPHPQKSSSDHNKTECTDMRTDCATLKQKYGCSSNLKTMYTQCTKTCNFCGKGNNLCMDYEDGCHMMAGSGACKDEALNETMSKMCPKSCGLCQASTPCDIQDTLF